MRNNLLILGAGIYQVPLIKKAKEMGLTTLVVSPDGDYPGKALADYYFPLDTRDQESILAVAKKWNIAGIVTTGTDVAMPALAYIAETLNLPGPSLVSAQRSSNKILMKQVFTEAGVQTAAFRVVATLNQCSNAVHEIGLPVMIKAVDSSGSRGITKVTAMQEVKDAYFAAQEVTRGNQVLVEKCLEGFEIGADAWVLDGEVREVFVHQKVATPPPISVPIGHSMPINLSAEVLQGVQQEVAKAAQALGVNHCFANADIMMVGNQPFIIEMGARMGATCLPEVIGASAGFDVYQAMIEMALARPITALNVEQVAEKKAAAAVLLTAETSGMIEAISVPSLCDYPQCSHFQLDVAAGDVVSAFCVGPDRIGHIVVHADTETEAVALAQEMAAQVVLSIADESEKLLQQQVIS